MKFDENLAAIHAYLCGDGYVIKNPKTQKKKYYYLGFRNTNLTLLKDFQKKFYSYFRVKPRLKEGERCIVQNKKIYEKVIKRFHSFYSREWEMPILNKKLTKIWLRAFFDCEGWVIVKSHQNRHIGMECVNKNGLDKIKNALSSFKIKSKIKKRRDRNIYSLYIFGKVNLIKFRNNIGFIHPDKKEKLDRAILDYVNYYWLFPDKKETQIIFIRKLMQEKAKMKKDTGIFRIISNKEENIKILGGLLNEIFNVESKINKRINGIGTPYFELNINKKDEIIKLIKNSLIKGEHAREWKKLKLKK